MKINNINQELLRAVKAPAANMDKLMTRARNQDKQDKTINKLEGKIDLDPSIIKEAN